VHNFELREFRMLLRAGHRMFISRRILLAGAVSHGLSARTLAEDKPLDLRPRNRVTPPKDKARPI
jgi:hypothetical protein